MSNPNNKKRYNDYLQVQANFHPVMTREAIDATPETWMEFFPHETYLNFLNALIEGVLGGTKSVWLYGNFGTGKSAAALVTQKLFLDDEARVKRWFRERKLDSALEKRLFDCRKQGVLVVYDYNADGLEPCQEFLARLERGVAETLQDNGLEVPSSGSRDRIVERLRREGANFFKTRDAMLEELAYLTVAYDDVEQIVAKIEQSGDSEDAKIAAGRLLSDVQKVFRRDEIFLRVDVPTFKRWISEALRINGLRRVVYIFDEFSGFIEKNKTNLKTLEDVTETPDVSQFFFVPTTHMSINAFYAEGSENAGKLTERFHFRKLEMPVDTAFKLAASALNVRPGLEDEWAAERDSLQRDVADVANRLREAGVVKNSQAFYDVLPIHPSAAYLLKHLAETAGANQRSLFEYLKGNAEGREFQDFIETGGPLVYGKQFLTVDYLWKYFLEREDLGQRREVIEIRSEFNRIRQVPALRGKTDESDEIRVLKAVLLFVLLSRCGGHNLPDTLRPTVTNVTASFEGDGALANAEQVVRELANAHCFSIADNYIELYSASLANEDLAHEVEKYRPKFHEFLIAEGLKDEIDKLTKSWRGGANYSAGRFEIRATGVSHTQHYRLQTATREKFGSSKPPKDDGSICLWFVAAQNKEESLVAPERIRGVLEHLRDHRIVMFDFPELTFCSDYLERWDEYVQKRAEYALESHGSAKEEIKKTYERIEREYYDKIVKKDPKIVAYYANQNGDIVSFELRWGELGKFFAEYVKNFLPCCADSLGIQTAFAATNFKNWAQAGLAFDVSQAKGQFNQLVRKFQAFAVGANDAAWFAQNPEHPLSKIRELFEKKIANTLGKNAPLSIRKVYIELQRYPYGLRMNGLSAFVLGFVLNDLLLGKGYRWTNDQLSQELDAETLAEIIEAVVKDDGADKIPQEKKICRLSKEEKAFVQRAPQMFGADSTGLSRVEDAINAIAEKAVQTAGRIPLWALGEHVARVAPAEADELRAVLEDVCIVCRVSSKGKVEERTQAIRRLGERILADVDLVERVRQYVAFENFHSGFQAFVERIEPELVALAERLGDATWEYRDAILAKNSETACWLWQEADVASVVKETLYEYRFVETALNIVAASGFTPFKKLTDVLETRVRRSLLPKSLIVDVWPTLDEFFDALQDRSAQRLSEAVKTNADAIRRFFYDDEHAEATRIIKSKLKTDSPLPEPEALDVLRNFAAAASQNVFEMNQNAFLNAVVAEVEKRVTESTICRLREEWRRVSGADSPDDWALNRLIPARWLFDPLDLDGTEFVKASRNPNAYSKTRLEELLLFAETLEPIPSRYRVEAFVTAITPKRFQAFDLASEEILGFLATRYGANPNDWPETPTLDDLFQKRYKELFAPKIQAKIESTDSETLKNKLLRLTLNHPEVGLFFWD